MIKDMKMLKKGMIFIAFSLFVFSCKKLEFDKIASTAWNPNLAVPLAYSTFGVYDILALTDSNDLVITDPQSGELSLVYRGELFSNTAQEVVQIPDLNENIDLTPSDLVLLPNVAFPNGQTIQSNIENTIELNTNAGVELHTLRLKEGTFSVQISTQLRHDVEIVLTLPEFTQNGSPITRTVNLDYAGSVPQTANVSINLEDAVADLTLNGTTVNTFEMITDVTITGTGQPITGTESVSMDLNLTGLEFENATGYFGQQNFTVSNDSILIKLFQNASSGYFELTNPRVDFIVENSFGFPARLNLNDLKTINANTGQEYPLTGYPSVININSPASLGQTVVTNLVLNSSNTANMNTIISSVPKYFYFEGEAISNPNGQTGTLNFIEDDSRLRIRGELELPLEGFAYGFGVKDTIDFNIGTDIDLIEYVMFRMIVDNGFPVDVAAQIKFMDQNYNPLFSIFNTPNTLIESALVDGTGKVNQRTKKINDIVLTQTQVDLLPQIKYLEIEGITQTLNGQNGQVVKLFDDYTIYVKLSMQVEGKTSF